MEKWNVSIWNRVRFGAGFGETDGYLMKELKVNTTR